MMLEFSYNVVLYMLIVESFGDLVGQHQHSVKPVRGHRHSVKHVRLKQGIMILLENTPLNDVHEWTQNRLNHLNGKRICS